ncbi:MAG: pyocin knob domain-containing protein, partial [Fusobacteriaceae bacterium]
EGLYSPVDHKHVWLDIDQSTVPIASESERGIVYLVDHLMSPSDQFALSSRAAIEKFAEIDAKFGDANLDFALKEHTHPWADIQQETIPTASVFGSGIVQLSNSISSQNEFTAATSKAIADVYDLLSSSGADYALKIHYHDAGDIQTGVLDIARGGTGRDFFSDGFVKSSLGSLESVEFLQIDDILGIRDAFAPMQHQHLWADILDPPTATAEEFGVVKITSDANDLTDVQNTAPSLLLYNFLKDKIDEVGNIEPIDAYTKQESDQKYIGYSRNLMDLEDLDFIALNGIYSKIDNTITISNEPINSPYILRVYNYQNVINQIIYDNDGGMYSRSLYAGLWTNWGRTWTDNDFVEATADESGLVKISENMDFGLPESVPTVKAVMDFVGTKGTEFEPIITILEVDKGGTGTSTFEHDNGFVRITTEGSRIMYSTASVEWEEITNVPLSSTDVAGVVKISDTVDHSDDPSTVAASLTLIKEIKEDIMGEVGVQAYTKEESDEKFLGKQEDLSIVDFDEVILAG